MTLAKVGMQLEPWARKGAASELGGWEVRREQQVEAEWHAKRRENFKS